MMKPKSVARMMLILLPALLFMGFNTPVSASDTSLTGPQKIGAIMSMTGDLATYGENEKAAAELAISEVNAFLTAIGEEWTLQLVVEDTQTDPAICLTKVESLNALGIKLLIGPLSSGELSNIISYCYAEKMLTISQSSTAPALAVDDYVFRFTPSDVWQGRSIAKLMYDDGIRYVVPTWMGLAWGDGLEEQGELRFEALGGNFSTDTVRYSVPRTDFSTEAALLNTYVTAALQTHNASEVAVWAISFEEIGAYMDECLNYPNLSSVKWYGSDGTVNTPELIDLADPDVSAFAVTTEFINPIFAPPKTAKYDKVRDHINATFGREPDSYSYNVYDIVWVYALSLLEVDAYDSEAVKAVLPTVARNYFGASGWIELDENGDRKPTDYDLWVVSEVVPGVEYEWKLVGKWISATDSVVWSPLPPSPVYVLEAVWDSKIFYVVTESNSTVSDYYFDPDEGPFIRFNVTGLEGTAGFCRVAIPKGLLWVEDGQWLVLVGGDPVTPTVIEEDNYTHLYFTYSHSTKTVEITGTSVVPEFPANLILPLFLVLTLIAVALAKKIRRKIIAKTT